MKNKLYAFAILALVYFFPFRWAFIETPQPTKVFATYVDGGGVASAIYMVISIAGMLAFLALMFKEDKEAAAH